MPSRRVSWSASVPRNSTSTRDTEPLPSPWARRPSFSHSGTKGATASIASGRTAAMLTAFVTTSPASAARTCSAVITPARSCASSVEAARCGVTTTSSRSKRGCSVMGSFGEDVERGAADLARLERPAEGVEVDELAARAVDDQDAVSHLRQRLVVDPVDRLGGLREVDRDHVGALVELVGALDALDAEVAEALRGDELVEPDHLHLEREGALGDELADAAEADHAERLAVELVSGVARARPSARRQASRAPGARCGRPRAPSRACARRPRPSSTPGR